MTKALVVSSGTSVNGLLMRIPAASRVRLVSRTAARRVSRPNEPVSVIELLAPDERRDRHARRHRPHPVIEDPEQEPCRALAGLSGGPRADRSR